MATRNELEVKFISRMLSRLVGEMNAEVCDQCGKCSSACPVSKEIEGFNPRQLIAKVSTGRLNGLLKEDAIWTCTTCLKCRERCPEEISPYDVILILRNLAYRAGYSYPKGYDDFIEGVKESGYVSKPQTVKTRDGGKMSREDMGLPEVAGPEDMGRFRGIVEGIIEAGKSG
ncbi:MAG TPA: 4Fe-4S dicluster domain-containing protein [Candidatus Bathyarchaeia archaeon]